MRSLLERAFACSLPGWKRVFVGESHHWKGTSVANVVPCSGDSEREQSAECHGYAIRLTSEEIERLDFFEGYPTWYTRESVQLKLHFPDQTTQLV